MALLKRITDPTDPTTEIDAYVRLALNNRPRVGLGLGLHAEFLAYRSKAAADAGGTPLAVFQMDIPAETYATLWDNLFSASALSPESVNPDAVVYAWAQRFDSNLKGCEALLDSGQTAFDLGDVTLEGDNHGI
jgi:hypothetical protein